MSTMQPYDICWVQNLTLLLIAAQYWLPECSPWPAMHHQVLAQAPSTCPTVYPDARPSAGMPALLHYPSGRAATQPAMDSGALHLRGAQDAPQQAIGKHTLPSDYMKASEPVVKLAPFAVELAHAEDQTAGAPGASAAEAADVAGHVACEGGPHRALAERASPSAVPALHTAGAREMTPARLLRVLLAGAAQLLAGYSLLRLAVAQVQLCKRAQISCLQHGAISVTMC